jgi:diphosphomevalonate decarboxylase
MHFSKVTTQASSDVALIKYWGKKNEQLRLPENSSLSMILDGLDTVTTVEFDANLNSDQVIIQGTQEPDEVARVIKHLERIRQKAGISTKAKVVSQNTFPKGTGLSSSGSGFAALTIAAARSAGLSLSERELSVLARMGSGTACRCVCGGFVQWRDANSSDESYSETLFAADYWDIRDVVAVVGEGKKNISSTEGHQSAQSSPFFQVRQEKIAAKIQSLKEALRNKDFTAFGEIIEAEALEFHSILLTSSPSLIAWYPGTVEVMRAVQQMRKEGIEAYFTINTGFNVHVLTLPSMQEKVQIRLAELTSVKKTLIAKVGSAPKVLSEHLF